MQSIKSYDKNCVLVPSIIPQNLSQIGQTVVELCWFKISPGRTPFLPGRARFLPGRQKKLFFSNRNFMCHNMGSLKYLQIGYIGK